MRTLVLILLLLPSAFTARAHDLHLVADPDGLRVAVVDHEHGGGGHEHVLPAPAEVVLLIDGVAADVVVPAGKTIPAPEDRTATAVRLEPLAWVRTPEGDAPHATSEGRTVLWSWRTCTLVKRLEHWGPGADRPLTGALELTPRCDPAGIDVGRKLRLRATLGGEPAAGVTVTYDGEVRGVTGDDGELNVRLRHGGAQRIAATLRLPDPDGTVDEIVHETYLGFAKE